MAASGWLENALVEVGWTTRDTRVELADDDCTDVTTATFPQGV